MTRAAGADGKVGGNASAGLSPRITVRGNNVFGSVEAGDETPAGSQQSNALRTTVTINMRAVRAYRKRHAAKRDLPDRKGVTMGIHVAHIIGRMEKI